MRCDYAYGVQPRDGEAECGDVIVARADDDAVLLAVVDALGHGSGAASVARLAEHALLSADPRMGVLELISALHTHLRGTRGAAALVLRVERANPARRPGRARVRGCSVGNVQLRSVRTRLPIVLSPGVLGVRISKARVFESDLELPERLVAFTDGISSRLDLRLGADEPARRACDLLLAAGRRGHDDASLAIVDVTDDD